jgi:squalene-hopene/tetraprenyl-beta-curcumene cyclase
MASGEIRHGGSAVSRLPEEGEKTAPPPEVEEAVSRARDWLLERQYGDGYWLGELEGDTILESEYMLLLAWLGRTDAPIFAKCAEYVRRQQLPEGGWSLYPGGPLEISSSVKAYWVLKIAGDAPDAEHMVRAREAILAAGGAEKVNSFTRYYLALLGIISYRQCPVVPPELILLPKWCPFNIYEMSSWSRTILVPLSLLWAYQPKTELPPEHQIDELFLTSPDQLPVTMPPSEQVDAMKKRTWLPWDRLFRLGDRLWKLAESLRLKPFRRRSVRLASEWILARLELSDGLGAIFPPIIWSVVALRCLGYEEDSQEVQSALKELEKLTIEEDEHARLEPCRSPVWDTSIAVNALRVAGVPATHPRIQKSVEWLLSKEVRRPGDWSVNHPEVEPGGWYFEFNNEFYPDVDDTIMVTMALSRCLPEPSPTGGGENGSPRHRLASTSPASPWNAILQDLDLVVTGQADSSQQAVEELERMQPMLAAMRRGVKWIRAMQSRNGGWGAFDADNDRELLTRVPFADHNAMIDPPTADITARVLEMFAHLGVRASHRFGEALEFVFSEQEPDGCWYGRWGVNYIYGTWQVLVGLTEFGIPADDPRIQAGADWLIEKQQPSGGWGETPRTYDEPHLRGTGPATASQTAWALLGLMAAGHRDSDAVRRGIEYLLETQREDGTWDEPWYTGTGFPRVFYLRYHLYRHYFPLMALGRFAQFPGC